nr:hypothetical protein [Tanacetum cinerariifolium]
MGEEEDFKRSLWVSAIEYVNANGGILVQYITKSLMRMGYGKDIIVRDALILDNVSIFSPKPSMHCLNITMRNVVKVFRKNIVPDSGSGVGRSEMLDKEEIMKLLEEKEMV